MNKIWIIIQREYLERVRKRSFIIITIVTPLLMAALFIVPPYLQNKASNIEHIAVIEKDYFYSSKLSDSSNLKFSKIPDEEKENIKNNLEESGYYALIDLSDIDKDRATLYSDKHISLSIKSQIINKIQSLISLKRISQETDLEIEEIQAFSSDINFKTILISEKSEDTVSSEIMSALGLLFGFLIYMFVFIYGSMVMRGVLEEKTNRIVEIIISSVKPFQLMMGKIVGVALVGFTQFALWIVLTFVISTVATTLLVNPADINPADLAQGTEIIIPEVNVEQGVIASVFEQLESINISFLLMMFLFYFVGGYLMYGSLFAAVGAAVDSETDTQQFMLPITIPLIFSFIALQTLLENPDSPLAFWCSIIPLTSPIVMMGRLPFDPPLWEIGLSMILLIIGFIFTCWIAGRIYRVGILMYGQKVNYKTLWIWIRQS